MRTTQGYGDFFLLGGEQSPGLCDCSGAGSPRKWEPRNGYGLSGAWAFFLGLGLSEFEITIGLFGRRSPPSEDWQDFERFERSVLQVPAINTRPKVLDIWHPDLVRLKISQVVILDVLQAVATPGGRWNIPIKLLTWRLPKLQMSKPEAAQAMPKDPYDKKIEELTGQLDALAKK